MDTDNKMVSFSAIGLYSPGLVSGITAKISELNGNIVDVEENARRGLFSIFLVVDFTASPEPLEHIQETLKGIEAANDLRVVVEPYGHNQEVHQGQPENHRVTVIGIDRPGIIAKISEFFHRLNIRIERCRMIARGRFFSMEMIIDTRDIEPVQDRSRPAAVERMKQALKSLCADIDQSVVIQSGNIYRRNKKLVVFDVESSLIRQFSLERFLDKIDTRILTGENLQQVQNGKDRMQALIHNAQNLKGMPVEELKSFSDILQLNPGTIELIKILKAMGFKIALLSSGFNFFLKKIFESAGVDYAFSNTLEVDDKGVTTGKLEEPLVTSETKEDILEFIMSTENIDRDQVIAVGDGSKSSHFIENVGLSIAIKPDDLSIETDGIISNDKIFNVLYCLGLSKSELEKYNAE